MGFQMTDKTSGVPRNQCIGSNIFCHHGARPDNRSSAYGHARKDNGSASDEDIISYAYRTFVQAISGRPFTAENLFNLHVSCNRIINRMGVVVKNIYIMGDECPMADSHRQRGPDAGSFSQITIVAQSDFSAVPECQQLSPNVRISADNDGIRSTMQIFQ